MRYLIVSGMTKQDVFDQSILHEAFRGAGDGGAEVQILTLDGIGRCKACEDEGSPCKTGRRCAIGSDGFDEAQLAATEAGAMCIVAPIQWGEVTEPLKGFLERLLRCEHGLSGSLHGKPILLIAVPDGMGGGMLTCLELLDRFCRQTGAVIFDYLCITRWNSDYQRASTYAAAKSMAYGRKAGEAG